MRWHCSQEGLNQHCFIQRLLTDLLNAQIKGFVMGLEGWREARLKRAQDSNKSPSQTPGLARKALEQGQGNVQRRCCINSSEIQQKYTTLLSTSEIKGLDASGLNFW